MERSFFALLTAARAYPRRSAIESLRRSTVQLAGLPTRGQLDSGFQLPAALPRLNTAPLNPPPGRVAEPCSSSGSPPLSKAPHLSTNSPRPKARRILARPLCAIFVSCWVVFVRDY